MSWHISHSAFVDRHGGSYVSFSFVYGVCLGYQTPVLWSNISMHWQTTSFDLVLIIFIKAPRSANFSELNCLLNETPASKKLTNIHFVCDIIHLRVS